MMNDDSGRFLFIVDMAIVLSLILLLTYSVAAFAPESGESAGRQGAVALSASVMNESA